MPAPTDTDHDEIELLARRHDTGAATGGISESSDQLERGAVPVEGGGVSVQALLDLIGFGRFHSALFIVCGFGCLVDGMWENVPSILLPQVVAEWPDSSKLVLGSLVAAQFAGLGSGSLAWGMWADGRGRYWPFRLMSVAATAGSILCVIAPTWWMLAAALCLVGFGVGGAIPVDSSVFVEYSPAKNRGAYLAALSFAWSLGSFLASLVGWAMIPSGSGWRAYCGVLGLFTAAVALPRWWYRETPAYLADRGKHAAASGVLSTIAKMNRSPALSTTPGLAGHKGGGVHEPSVRRALLRLWTVMGERPKLKRAGLLIWGAWFGAVYGSIGLASFLLILVQGRGIGDSDNLYQDSLMYSGFGLIGAFAGTLAVETRIGRKGTMWMSTSAACVSLAGAALSSATWLVVLFAALANAFFQAMFAGLSAYTVEVFPTSVRSTGAGVANMCSRVAGVIAPIVFGSLQDSSDAAALTASGIVIAITVVLMIALPIETRNYQAD